MPAYKVPKPDIPNIASRLPEPLRKPAGMAMQGLMDLFGGDEADVSQMAPVAPLVTLYRNPAVRQEFTQKFLEKAKSIYPEHLGPQIEALVNKYPRVAAHTRLSGSQVSPEGVTEWSRAIPNWNTSSEGLTPADGARYKVLLNEPLAKQAGSPDILAHEMTHVAQRLGNKATSKLYDLAMEGLDTWYRTAGYPAEYAKTGAYLSNPFERSARDVALRKTRGVQKPASAAIKGLEEFAAANPENKSLKQAMEILRSR